MSQQLESVPDAAVSEVAEVPEVADLSLFYRPESMAATKTKLITTSSGAKGSPKAGAATSGRDPGRPVASNRRARHDYEILDTVECGLVLQGSEVKSLREGRIALQDSYARIIDGEMWLFGVHIPPYAQANGFGAHDPDRRRKLLLHRRQIDEWMGRSQQQSLTMVPLSIYFVDGRAKVEIALAKGKDLYDKRQSIQKRDMARDVQRELREVGR